MCCRSPKTCSWPAASAENALEHFFPELALAAAVSSVRCDTLEMKLFCDYFRRKKFGIGTSDCKLVRSSDSLRMPGDCVETVEIPRRFVETVNIGLYQKRAGTIAVAEADLVTSSARKRRRCGAGGRCALWMTEETIDHTERNNTTVLSSFKQRSVEATVELLPATEEE